MATATTSLLYHTDFTYLDGVLLDQRTLVGIARGSLFVLPLRPRRVPRRVAVEGRRAVRAEEVFAEDLVRMVRLAHVEAHRLQRREAQR